ncbi:hypothetical protein WMY93_013997 [Mugilogobius chulae]|uniref:Gypsy retrotransposon integrase-like protein 1 n=1 Tax=Mugilogobius chulae TaxID=88201 RepID=A0AAW0P3A0_9GOBI
MRRLDLQEKQLLSREREREFELRKFEAEEASRLTRAMAAKAGVSRLECDLEDSFMADLEEKLSDDSGPARVVTAPAFPASCAGEMPGSVDFKKPPPFDCAHMSREHLKTEQKQDKSLAPLFESAVTESELSNMSSGYYIKNDILFRRWTPPYASPKDEWSVVSQVVVPSKFRHEVLSLAHDNPLAGHLGIRKTYSRILRQFYWPGLKKDVQLHCKTCHVCQVAGKSTPPIPPYPLYPIPAVDAPFDRLIVDCVGPLPRTKSGNQYLLTIMCASTRFPEAIPMRKITAPAVVKALVKFFSLFGLPKVVQTDQGTNFMSRVFAQVAKELNITHCFSSAYHPESQGALERFHQTLKSMLRAYCLEFEKEWDDGIHLLLFAAREMVQESTGFSPADLVFAHSVRGPLQLLQEKWLGDPEPQNVLDYVSSFRSRLHRACELAKQNLTAAQSDMKCWFDKKAKARHFNPGDKVLVFLPLPGSSLQARYSGPYVIQKKISDRDYVVATPDRGRRSRLCHVNMLKPYYDREQLDKPSPDQGAVLALSNAPVTDSPLPLSSSLQVSDSVSLSGAEDSPCAQVERSGPEVDCDIDCPSVASVQGRLNNSQMLANIDNCFLHLSSAQRTDVVELIESHLSLFSDVPSRTQVLHHDIDVGDNAPIKQHPYRVNPEKRQRLQSQVDYMLSHGIAEPSLSPWSSPCLLAIKSDGSDRFCTDFRKVNGVTKPDSHPLPRMEDCVDRVGSAVFVSKLDLLKGYWQVPLTPRAKEICAFATSDAFLQYTVMPFGVRNAPATFQRLVNRVLRGVPGCEAYLDDIVIHSKTWDEHISQLREVFRRLDNANLTINLAKCEIGKATVVYLGKIVGGGMVKPVQAKIEAIAAFPVPVTRRELQRFLGMAGYYRSFCKNFSAVAAPLTSLLSPKVTFKWSPECQHSFESIKTLLIRAPVLAAPSYERPFQLAVDASDAGVGAVLLQTSSDGVEHPVCYFSKKFLKHQLSYSMVEKECLALIMALKNFEVYLGSSNYPVTVYTDHNPLVFINQMRNSNQRLMRWAVFLQDFNLAIKHVPGKSNVLADALSRAASC